MTNDKVIKNALDFDPIAEAEDMLGEPLNQDNFGLGLVFAQEKRAMINRLMAQSGDVSWATSYQDYCKVAEDIGFNEVYSESFVGSITPKPETLKCFWSDLGFLLVLESCDSVRVNTANIYYNIQVPKSNRKDFWGCVSSGGYAQYDEDGDDNVWAGHHDVRDALKYHMSRLQQYGTPLKQWVEDPYVWLVNHSETRANEKVPWSERSGKFNALNRAKIERFPAYLRDMIKASMIIY